MDTSAPALSSTLFLDRVGEVVLTLNPTGLSWNPASIDPEETFCCQMMFPSEAETDIRFSDVYAVEFTGLGLINGLNSTEMYRFVVHGFQRGKNSTSPSVLSTYTFGHRDAHTCQALFDQINACMKVQVGRPKNLLVFVHPQCGKGNGRKTWEVVAPLFSRAKVTTKVTVTQRAGHAYDILKSSTDRELRSFDGIIAVRCLTLQVAGVDQSCRGKFVWEHNSTLTPVPIMGAMVTCIASMPLIINPLIEFYIS